MFEHYLQHQIPDTRRRWRVALAVNLAGFATAGMLGFTWMVDKLTIAQVAPSSASFVMVQMSMESLPPPPPPPAAPALQKPVEVEPEPDEEEDETPPDFVEELPTPRPRATQVVGNGLPHSTGTAVFGGPPRVPGIPIGIPGTPPGVGIPVRPSVKTEARAPVPISSVRAQALYAPHPDQARLGATRAATFDKRAGVNETSFCVDPQGRTTEIRTVKQFPGDPKVDEICRDTIKTWRFKPFLVDGRPTRTCSVQVFNISFK